LSGRGQHVFLRQLEEEFLLLGIPFVQTVIEKVVLIVLVVFFFGLHGPFH
jgi:hypothetical protein